METPSSYVVGGYIARHCTQGGASDDVFDVQSINPLPHSLLHSSATSPSSASDPPPPPPIRGLSQDITILPRHSSNNFKTPSTKTMTDFLYTSPNRTEDILEKYTDVEVRNVNMENEEIATHPYMLRKDVLKSIYQQQQESLQYVLLTKEQRDELRNRPLASVRMEEQRKKREEAIDERFFSETKREGEGMKKVAQQKNVLSQLGDALVGDDSAMSAKCKGLRKTLNQRMYYTHRMCESLDELPERNTSATGSDPLQVGNAPSRTVPRGAAYYQSQGIPARDEAEFEQQRRSKKTSSSVVVSLSTETDSIEFDGISQRELHLINISLLLLREKNVNHRFLFALQRDVAQALEPKISAADLDDAMRTTTLQEVEKMENCGMYQ